MDHFIELGAVVPAALVVLDRRVARGVSVTNQWPGALFGLPTAVKIFRRDRVYASMKRRFGAGVFTNTDCGVACV